MLFNERRQKINLCKITADLTSFYVLSSAACLLWSGRPCSGQCHFHKGSGTAINNFEPRILIHNCDILQPLWTANTDSQLWYSAAIVNSEYWFTIVIFCSHCKQRILIHNCDILQPLWTANTDSQLWYSAAILNSEYWFTIVIFCSHFEQRILIHNCDILQPFWTAITNSKAWFYRHFKLNREC